MRTVSNSLVMAFSQFVVVVSVFLAKAPKSANAQTNIFSYIATNIFTNIIYLQIIYMSTNNLAPYIKEIKPSDFIV